MIMKMKEIRSLEPAELQNRLRELSQERLNLNIQKKMGQLEKSSRFGVIRRTKARILTELRAQTLKSQQEDKKNKK